MPNDLPIPPELQHLIEKRERAERRKRSRRTKPERRDCDFGPLGAVESISDLEDLPLEDRRSRQDRRNSRRRRSARRKQ
jgi:hypothetical protein